MNYDINILIVEDLFTTRLFLRRTLKKLGYTNVVLSEDGQTALKELEQKQFDLIISDWHMPNMDGLDFYKALSKNRKWSEIPFLLITAEKERDKVIEAVKAGIKEYLVKPVVPEKLGSKIKEVVFGGAD
ncbi:MAG: response regulator [Nitrospinaceae bacterium]|jgi:two-component system, chemotaxis family, chemotaxis protein CheY|nr:response regulator [Nitrospina sp.]MBT5869137.1 response regulator [Nitrospinaceae bacterium]MBT6346666.1 response regulator [Nitrospina sp.]